MNTAQIISRYATSPTALDMTPAQLSHEIMQAYRDGLRDAVAVLERKHPRSTTRKLVEPYTVGAKA